MWKRKSKKENNNIEIDSDLNWNEDNQLNDQYQQDVYDDEDEDLFPDQEKYQTKKRKPKDKEYYVKGSELKEEILKYQQSKRKNAQKNNIPYEQAQGDISEALGTMIIKICTRFSMHPRFFGYSFRDEFVADAVPRCITHRVDKINLSLPNCNPFSYLTQIAFNVFRQKIKSQKKYSQTKQKLRDQVYSQFQKEEGLEQTKDNEEDE